MFPLGLFAQDDLQLKGHLIAGVDKFKSENYEDASMSFATGGSLEGYEDIATYNRGLSLLASENLEDAGVAFSSAIETSSCAKRKRKYFSTYAFSSRLRRQ